MKESLLDRLELSSGEKESHDLNNNLQLEVGDAVKEMIP